MGDENWLPEAGGPPVVVYGGGETGCETAEYLAERGHEVVLVSRSPAAQLARSAEMIYRGVLLKRLAENPRIRILDNRAIVRIEPATVILEAQGGEHSTIACSRVLIAQGRRPDDSLPQQLAQAGIPFVAIGDARKGGRIGDAVHSAYAAVCALRTGDTPVRELAC